MNRWHSSVLTVGALMLAACATPPSGRSPAPGTGASRPVPGAAPGASAQASAARRGGYYLDDGPGDAPPADLAAIPDAQPRLEPLHRWANRPYVVFDRQYVPMTRLEPFRERGVGSWYGRKFHGQRTASGEVYDMYAMTAAHPTLPIPSYVRVTHTRSGRSVVVRVNDRGPFLHGRVIDLSWTAAAKLGYAQGGSGEVEVELLVDPAGFADAGPAGARAGAPGTPALAMMAIADTPQRIVPLAGGTGGALPSAAGQAAGASWQQAAAAGSAAAPQAAPAASAPATAAPVTTAPAAAAPGATAPGATAPGVTAPGVTAPGAQALRAVEAAPPERLDVETVIAPAPPAPPPSLPQSSGGSGPAIGSVGTASAPGAGGPPAGAPPSAAAAPASASAASATAATPAPAPARAGIPAHAPGAAVPPGQVLYLQIGAFALRDNALAARSRAAAVLGVPAERIQLRSGEGSLFKVLAGPFTQRADALAAADKLRQSTDLRPVPALLPR